MTIPPLDEAPEKALRADRPDLRIVVTFEDADAQARAAGLCQRLARQAGPDLHLETGQWSFDALLNPELRQAAAHDAAHADLIMVAARGESQLPTAVREWIDTWLGQMTEADRALVALLDQPGQKPARTALISAYLRDVAERGGLTFFCDAERTAPLEAEVSAPVPPLKPSRSREWGINE